MVGWEELETPVDFTVAVVVDAVADLGESVIHIRIGIIAVPRHWTENRTFGGLTSRDAFYGVSITVIVDARPDFIVGIIHDTGVGVAVAVVVDAVAELVGGGVDGGVAVVAVLPVVGVPFRHVARLDFGAAAVAVAIGVGVVGLGGALVDLTVAVVVDLVADLRGAGVDLGVGIVAVLRPYVDITIRACELFVAVAVDAVGGIAALDIAARGRADGDGENERESAKGRDAVEFEHGDIPVLVVKEALFSSGRRKGSLSGDCCRDCE